MQLYSKGYIMKKECIFPSCPHHSVTKSGHCNGHRKQFQKGQELRSLKEKPKSMICIFPDCKNKRDCQAGYCGGHKKQLKLGKSLTPLRISIKVCTFVGCNRRHYRQGLCAAHDRQRSKEIPLTPIKTQNKRGQGGISTHGYKIYCKNINGKKTYLYEHRLVMEQYLGRKLFDSENVHHLNGNKLDNRIENLELWSIHQPQGQRVIDKIKWAHEILEAYKNEIHLLNQNQASLN